MSGTPVRIGTIPLPTNARIDGRIDAQKGAPSGLAQLGGDGRVPDAELPERLGEAALSTTIDGRVGGVAQTHVAPLAPWQEALRSSPSTAKVALIGPSTVDSGAAGVGRHNRWKRRIAPGDVLAGMTEANILNFGYNGQTAAQITSSAHMADLASAAPDLWNASGLLINTYRTGALPSITAATAELAAAVERIRAAVPGVPGVLETGNMLLGSDPTNTGWVTPLAEAAAKSEVIRQAHLNLIGRWPDVIVRDVMLEVYGGTDFATHPYMNDLLHPNSAGMTAEVDALMPLIGYAAPAAPGRALAARNASPFAPWTLYGREVEDTTRYALVAEADYQNQGATFVDFAYPAGIRNNIARGDIVELPGGVSFQLPNAGTSINANGTSTRLIVPSGTIPANTITKGTVRVWRRRVGGDAAVEAVLRDSSWRYKKIGIVAAGSSAFVQVSASSVTAERSREVASDWAATVQAGDLLYVEGAGSTPATVTAGAFDTSGTNLRLTGGLNGVDFSSLIGRIAVLVGNHA